MVTRITVVCFVLCTGMQAAFGVAVANIISPTQTSPVTVHPGGQVVVTYSYDVRGDPHFSSSVGMRAEIRIVCPDGSCAKLNTHTRTGASSAYVASATSTFQFADPYYWPYDYYDVSAKLKTGDSSYTFATDLKLDAVLVVDRDDLDAPTLISPQNGATVATPRPTFQWGSVSGATRYILMVDDEPTFTQPYAFYSGGNIGTDETPAYDLPDDHYYWRVRAGDASDYYDWSDVWEFDMEVYPDDPIIYVTPPDGLDFETVEIGDSAEATFTVENCGGGTLTGSATGLSAPFSFAGETEYDLPGGHNTEITVKFEPANNGTYSDTISFTGGGGASRTVSGIGEEPIVHEELLIGGFRITADEMTTEGDVTIAEGHVTIIADANAYGPPPISLIEFDAHGSVTIDCVEGKIRVGNDLSINLLGLQSITLMQSEILVGGLEDDDPANDFLQFQFEAILPPVFGAMNQLGYIRGQGSLSPTSPKEVVISELAVYVPRLSLSGDSPLIRGHGRWQWEPETVLYITLDFPEGQDPDHALQLGPDFTIIEVGTQLQPGKLHINLTQGLFEFDNPKFRLFGLGNGAIQRDISLMSLVQGPLPFEVIADHIKLDFQQLTGEFDGSFGLRRCVKIM